MTERELIDDILSRIEQDGHGYIDWIDDVGRGLLAAPLEAANARIRELEREIERLREIEADTMAANLLGPDGKVRRVLGTLPVTRDGVIVPLFENLWFIDRFATKNCDGKYGLAVARAVPTSSTLSDGMLEFRASFGVDVCHVSECYSTREAAQAAKEEDR